MSETSSENILGYPVTDAGLPACVESIAGWIGSGDRCRWVACINPHSYAISLGDGEFSKALRSADWLIPDGIGMVLASRLLKGTVRERVTGSDLFAGVSEKLNAGAGARVFFLGARDETLVKIRQRMAVDYPNIVVAGTLAPPYRSRFSPAETAAMLEAIERADADVLWVGMTSPKQDLWIYQNRDRLNVRFAAGIGAGFDFYAGDVKRPRPVFRRLGLEWLPRLLNEPVRLWRRTFVSAPIFLWHVCRALMGSRRSLD